MTSVLFQPIRIGNVEVKNRFVRSATHEWMCEEDGMPKPELGDLMEGLAKGGVGLILTGYSYVNPKGKSMAGQNAIYDDSLVEPYREIVERVHWHGAKIFMQIVHGGRQAWVGHKETGEAIAPSAVPDKENDITPKEMTVEEIWGTISEFVQAARRAFEAGFDGVQLHMAHGFLLSSFISPYTNRRTDEWGGSLENRARIIIEIIRLIRENVSADFPIMAKINSTDGFMEEDKGLQVEESVDIAKILAAEGLRAVEVSDGIYEAGASSSRKGVRDESLEGYFLEYAARFKAELDIPVICVGGMRSLSVMNKAVSSGHCDMISICRPFIREPDLVKKLQSGRSEKADCISCNQCFDPTGVKCNWVTDLAMPRTTAIVQRKKAPKRKGPAKKRPKKKKKAAKKRKKPVKGKRPAKGKKTKKSTKRKAPRKRKKTVKRKRPAKGKKTKKSTKRKAPRKRKKTVKRKTRRKPSTRRKKKR